MIPNEDIPLMAPKNPDVPGQTGQTRKIPVTLQEKFDVLRNGLPCLIKSVLNLKKCEESASTVRLLHCDFFYY